MDELRMILAAATGAVIGGVVVVALAWTLRVLGEARDAAHEALVPATGMSPAPHRSMRLHWAAKVAILAVAILGYGYVGYTYHAA